MTILSRNSPLRGIPTGFGDRQILFIEGLRLAIEMIDIAYTRLVETVASISQLKTDAGTAGDDRYILTANALLDAWSIVDSTDRARDLLERFPGLIHKDTESPGRKHFLSHTEKIAKLRDIVQHMRQDFYRVEPSPEQRAWGALHWLYRVSDEPIAYKSFVFNPGCAYGSPKYGILGYLPTLPTERVARVMLQCRGVKANLSKTVALVRVLAGELEKAMRHAAPGDRQRGFDMMFHMDLHIDPTKPADDSPSA